MKRKTIFLPNIWELKDENVHTVFNALNARYGKMNARTFKKKLIEYLLERGVVHLRVGHIDTYYREDEKVYNEYLEACKLVHIKPMDIHEFYRHMYKKAYKEVLENVN